MSKEDISRTLEDRCSKCHSQWGKDWELCQRCGHSFTESDTAKKSHLGSFRGAK